MRYVVCDHLHQFMVDICPRIMDAPASVSKASLVKVTLLSGLMSLCQYYLHI